MMILDKPDLLFDNYCRMLSIMWIIIFVIQPGISSVSNHRGETPAIGCMVPRISQTSYYRLKGFNVTWLVKIKLSTTQ